MKRGSILRGFAAAQVWQQRAGLSETRESGEVGGGAPSDGKIEKLSAEERVAAVLHHLVGAVDGQVDIHCFPMGYLPTRLEVGIPAARSPLSTPAD